MGLYGGIFLVTLSGLMFEIGLTRIFSAAIWYHFTFIAISVALLGWGLGGFVVHLLKKRVAFSLDRVALTTLLYAASIPICLWLIVRTPLHPDRLAFYFAVSLVPFFLAGTSLSMVFDLKRSIADRLYFADLVGASGGALLITWLLSWLGGESAVLAIALAPAIAAVLFSRRWRFAGLAAVGIMVVLVVANGSTGFFNIRSAPTKGLYRHMAATPGSKIVLTGWNAYSRIDAVTGFASPYLARMYIDSDAWTNVLEWDGRLESLAPMRSWYRALPFTVAPANPKTLVIGPGGGSDVLSALAMGSSPVTAVEMNPLMLRFARSFGIKAGNFYDHPDVETILSEGRTFIRRSNRTFDVILLGFVDSWAAVASGGLSLSENHLYTTEAFRDYYDHLTPDGMLVILRWDVDIPRLVANSIAFLGPKQAGERIAAFLERRGTAEDPRQMIFMLRKRPFSESESARMTEQWNLAVPVIVPGRIVEEPYLGLFSGRTTLDQWERESPVRVDPVFDNRPFFFARQKPWGLPDAMSRAFLTILAPIGIICLLFVATGKPRGTPVGPYAGSIVYFSCLGLGFIAVELSVLQHLTLLLGHPIFTLSILLFTLLAFGGLGSSTSRRFPIRQMCLLVGGLGGLYAVMLPRIVPVLLPLPLWARIGLAIAVVAPLGFAMGMPFPRGLQATGQGSLAAPPFYWGLNGIFSVAGSISAMVLAVTAGFTVVMLAGSLCYLVAAAASGVFEGQRVAAPVE